MFALRSPIFTPRLQLRAFTPTDLDALYELDRDPAVMRLINGGTPSTYGEIRDSFLPQILAYQEKYDHFGFWAVCDRTENAFIGWLVIRPASDFKWAEDCGLAIEGEVEIGWRLVRSQWGKGYATEGARVLVEKGFRDWGVETFVAWTLAINQPSRRVMEKLGMTPEREFDFAPYHLPSLSPAERKGVKYRLDRRSHLLSTIRPN
jgi:ribosomal-protein-alanine N-acetyltransferase